MWLSIIGAALLVLLGIVLFVPLRVICKWDGALLEIRLKHLGVSYKIWKDNLFERAAPSENDHEDSSPKDRVTTLSEIVDRVEALIDHKDTLVRMGRLILRFAREFRGWWGLEESAIDVTFGLGNPAHTGMALGGLSALAGMVRARWPALSVVFRADFERITLNSRGEVTFRIRLWDPVWDIIRTLVAAPWRGIWKLRRDWAYQE